MTLSRRSFAAAFLAPSLARAQTRWPGAPVRYILPFGPGGGVDILSRFYCAKLGQLTDQSIVVENRPGAAGNLGTEAIARSPADGTVIGLGTVASLAIAPTLFARLPFDVARDFTYVSGLWQLPNVLVVNNAVPANTVPELIALLRANPGQYAYASSGSGTAAHLSAEIFKSLAGLDILHVPYRSAPAAHVDLHAGRVHMYFDNIPQAMAVTRDGKVRALAVTSAQRSPYAPELPTMSEFLPGFEMTSWGAVIAPAGLSQGIIERLNALTKQALESEDLIQRFRDNGAAPWWTTPADLARFRAANEAALAPVIRASGARVE